MIKYVDTEKLKAEIERKIGICEQQRTDAIEAECYNLADDASARMGELRVLLETITSLQQEQPKLYKDETLGSPDYERGFKHGRDYQTEVTRKYTNKDKVIAYLVDKGYPVSTNGEIPTYQETFDMINNAIKYANKHEQPEVDLEKFTEKMDAWKARFSHPDDIPIKATMAFTARMFYMYPNTAREWYESLPKATMDNARNEE